MKNKKELALIENNKDLLENALNNGFCYPNLDSNKFADCTIIRNQNGEYHLNFNTNRIAIQRPGHVTYYANAEENEGNEKFPYPDNAQSLQNFLDSSFEYFVNEKSYKNEGAGLGVGLLVGFLTGAALLVLMFTPVAPFMATIGIIGIFTWLAGVVVGMPLLGILAKETTHHLLNKSQQNENLTLKHALHNMPIYVDGKLIKELKSAGCDESKAKTSESHTHPEAFHQNAIESHGRKNNSSSVNSDEHSDENTPLLRKNSSVALRRGSSEDK